MDPDIRHPGLRDGIHRRLRDGDRPARHARGAGRVAVPGDLDQQRLPAPALRADPRGRRPGRPPRRRAGVHGGDRGLRGRLGARRVGPHGGGADRGARAQGRGRGPHGAGLAGHHRQGLSARGSGPGHRRLGGLLRRHDGAGPRPGRRAPLGHGRRGVADRLRPEPAAGPLRAVDPDAQGGAGPRLLGRRRGLDRRGAGHRRAGAPRLVADRAPVPGRGAPAGLGRWRRSARRRSRPSSSRSAGRASP